MEVNQKCKVSDLFAKFCRRNYKPSAYHLENLLKVLETDKHALRVINTPFFSDILINTLNNIETDSKAVKLFLLAVVQIMLRNELQFYKFMQTAGGSLVKRKLLVSDSLQATTALNVAYEKIAVEILSHSSGIALSMQHKLYTLVFQPNLQTCPGVSVRMGYEYISKLVWKLDEVGEEEALMEVLSYILQPIINNKYQFADEVTDTADQTISNELVAYLRAFQEILNDTDRIVHKNKVIPLLTNFLLSERPLTAIIGMMLGVARLPELVLLLANIAFRLAFAAAMCNNVTANELYQEIIATYYNSIMMMIDHKRMTPVMIQYAASCIKFWWGIDENVVSSKFERNGRTYDMKDQFLAPPLMPIIFHGNSHNAPYLDGYALKLISIATEHLIKVAYVSSTVMQDGNLDKYAIEALMELSKLINRLNDKQAGYIYQALYYSLYHYVKNDENDGPLTVEDSPISCPLKIKIISISMAMIKLLLTKYNINWYESVEIVSLQSCLMNLVKRNLLPTKLLLQAMDLIDLSIQKQLSPDLALLVESRPGSTLQEIMAMMKSFLRHQEWEIRDSALHLLFSCTDIAFIKYLPLQRLLLENDLIQFAAHVAVFDDETYVQATALRCLAAATRIESIWRAVTACHSVLYSQLINILRDSPEGMVRKEAAKVLTEIYTHQKTSREFVCLLASVMVSAALDDLHWEVQLMALNFWRATIKHETSKRGMIDGKFPTSTFCTEKRKIIILKDDVIQEQLTKILNKLANLGCLKVLIKSLNEDNHIRVLEEAYAIAKDLMSIIDEYKFDMVPESMIQQPEEIIQSNNNNGWMDVDDFSMEMSPLDLDRERVIESITNTNFNNLILELSDNERIENHNKFAINKWMNPNEFLSILRNSNYVALIESKSNWNSTPTSLDAVMDELLSDDKNEQIFEDF